MRWHAKFTINGEPFGPEEKAYLTRLRVGLSQGQWEVCVVHNMTIPHSRKYWRELNLTVEPKIAIARILADLNLAVRYGITIRILYASMKFWLILIWRL